MPVGRARVGEGGHLDARQGGQGLEQGFRAGFGPVDAESERGRAQLGLQQLAGVVRAVGVQP